MKLTSCALILFLPILSSAQQTELPAKWVEVVRDFTQAAQVPAVRTFFTEDAKKAATDRFTCGKKPTPASPLSPELEAFCLALAQVVDLHNREAEFASYVLSKSTLSADARAKTIIGGFLKWAETKRLDEQIGSAVGSSGTSSVASRVGIADILNLAVESGAVTQSVNGNSATLQANALSLERFLVGQEVLPDCADPKACEKGFDAFLKNLSGTATFDLTHPAAQTATGTTTAGTPATATVFLRDNSVRLSSLTVRYEVYNKFNLRSKAYRDAFQCAVKASNTALIEGAGKAVKASKTLTPLVQSDEHTTYRTETMAKVESVVRANLDAQADQLTSRVGQSVQTAVDQFIETANGGGMLKNDEILAFYQAQAAFGNLYTETMATVLKKTGTGFSIEYTNNKPVMQPRTSNVKAIVGWHPQSGNANFTFNLSATLYDCKPMSAMSNWKDLQVALQLDRRLGETRLGDTTFTLAGYYQYQHEASAIQIGPGDLAPNTNIVLPSGSATLLAPKGHLAVAQAQFVVKAKSGSKIPLGVTWSNRTELIKAKEVRGHIGFTFDWDTLLAGSKSN